MMSKPAFSVVLPVRNGESYIREAIESVLAQTHPHFNLFVLENCSQDRTVEIVQSYQDLRIHLLETTVPLPIEENWQRILGLELDEYITIIGHDDRFAPNFLSELVALIEQYPDASLYHGHFHLIDDNGERIRKCWPMPERETGDGYMRSIQQLRGDSYGTGFVARSAEYKQVGGLPPFPRLMFADHIAWYRLASLRGKVCSPKYLFEYRRHARSTGASTSLVDFYHASKQYIAALAKTDYFKSSDNVALTKSYVEYSFNGHCHRILADLIYNGTSESMKAFRATKAQFMAEAEQDKLFTVYDTACKVYEGLAAIPIRPLRKLLFKPIELIRSYRQHQREHVPTD